MVGYYAQRAREYESIYAKPERQQDLQRLRTISTETLRDHTVLEISCGTGFWTDAFAQSARSVLACDINREVLEIARHKDWNSAPIEFMEADCYALPAFNREFSAAFAGFWWSHIPRRRLLQFLRSLHTKLAPGAKVMFIDNRYIAGSSTPIARTDEHGDSFQIRHLADGSAHQVLKNFPSPEELLQTVAPIAVRAEVTLTDYFWVLRYETW
jgi:SAM-dependent methyltransferase